MESCFNTRRLMLVLVVALALMIPMIFSEKIDLPPDGIYLVRPNASQSQTVDYRPEYITSENLVFYTCLEGIDSAFSSILCKDNDINISELPTYPWENGCFISFYDLNQTDCNQIVLQTEYPRGDEILRITDEVILKNVNSIPYNILKEQYADGGWGDSISTAYALWVFSKFNSNYFQNTYQEQIESALTWLKQNRDDDEKCWPENDCNIKTTALVLALLSESGYADQPIWHRIIHDGTIWLKKKQNVFNLVNMTENDESLYNWSLQITGKDWTVSGSNVSANYTSCYLSFGSQINQTLNVEFDKSYNISFNPIHEEVFDFICTPNTLDVLIYNGFENVVFNSTTANMSYVVPGGCWDDEEPWQPCDVETSIFASLVNMEDERINLAKSWLYKTIIEDAEGAYINSTKNIEDTSWYLFNRYSKLDDAEVDSETNSSLSYIEQKMVQWLIFQQNNDGFWGNETAAAADNIILTALATMALDKVNNVSYSESISDANHWISLNEPANGWDTTEKNALSFLTFSRSAKPFIRSNPLLAEIKLPKTKIQLYNPSSFDFVDLEFILDNNLSEFLSVDPIGSLLSDYYKDVYINQIAQVDSNKYGYLHIYDNEIEISKIPILVRSVPTINITPSSDIYIFSGKGIVEFNVLKSGDVLDCDLIWEDSKITTKSKFRISDQTKVTTEIVISEIKNQDINYDGQFNCKYADTTIELPFSLVTKQFDTIPFSITPSIVYINSSDEMELPYFTIYNNVDKPISLNIEFKSEDAYLALDSPMVELPPLGSQDVGFMAFFPPNETIQYNNSIVANAYGKESEIDVVVSIVHKEKRSSFILTIIMFVIIFGGLGGVGYVGFLYRDRIVLMMPSFVAEKLNLLVNKKGIRGGSSSANIPEIEKKVEAKNFIHIAEIIKIMVGLGQDEDYITKRLKGEGYNDGEIAEVFSRVRDEMDNEQLLDKEEKFMKMMKSLESDVGATRSKLKQEGFTDQEIAEAFKQSETEIATKEKDLKQKMDDDDRFNVSEEESKAAAQKAKDGGGGGD